MSINIRQKGAGGEREVITLLEPVVRRVMLDTGYPIPEKPIIQRNQNQTAVGGSDLTNTFGLAIEVKRQETLAVNQWWMQCVNSASRNGEIPVLMYRQNQKKWHVVMHGTFGYPPAAGEVHCSIRFRATITLEHFLEWFALHVRGMLAQGYQPKV